MHKRGGATIKKNAFIPYHNTLKMTIYKHKKKMPLEIFHQTYYDYDYLYPSYQVIFSVIKEALKIISPKYYQHLYTKI